MTAQNQFRGVTKMVGMMKDKELPTHKVCKCCGQTKPITEFYGARPKRPISEATKKRYEKLKKNPYATQPSQPRKVSARCAPCVIAAKVEKMQDPNHYLNKPENFKWRKHYEEQKARYDAIDERKHQQWAQLQTASRREMDRERRQRYLENNPEKAKQYAKEWREKNKAAISEAQRKYYEENRERILAKRREAYERKKALELL